MVFKCFFCKCFKSMFQVFHHVASVAYRCFKSKSGVASPSPRLASVSSPPSDAGWASSTLVLLFPMMVTFGAAKETYFGRDREGRRRSPARHEHAESGGGTGRKWDGAWLSGQGGAEGATVCADTRE
jgi:hypothetical protein